MLRHQHLSRLISFLLAVVFFVTIFNFGNNVSNAATTISSKITVKVSGRTVKLPYAPTIVSNVILAPAEALVKSLGGKYKYASKTKTITITKSKTSVVLKINSKTVKVNGKSVTITVSPKLIKVPFIPVKFIGEKLGFTNYTYDSKKRILNLKIPTPAPKVHIYIAGDSTAETRGTESYPAMGFGQVLGNFFDKTVVVNNYAISGFSSKSFADSGFLDTILSVIKPGDYLFISFGHNDQKSNPDLHTEPYTTYQEYLIKYITEARRKKAIPVLITPVNRRLFDANGKLEDSLGDYPEAMIQLGIKVRVPVIDLNGQSKILFESLGPEKCKELFLWLNPGEYPAYPDGVQDDSHFQEKGALEIDKIIVDGIRKVVGAPLTNHLL